MPPSSVKEIAFSPPSGEANFMLKNGHLSSMDIKGKNHYMTASGDIHEGTVITLKEVKVGEAILHNVDASEHLY